MDAAHRIPPTEEQPPAPETGGRQSQRVLLWGSVALLALVVLLSSLMSQQPDVSWGGPGERLMPQLPDAVAYALLGLFALGGVAVLAVLFPRGVRFRRKKKPDEFQLYQEPQKFSPGVFVVLILATLIPIGLIVYLYWSGWEPFGKEQGLQQQAPLIHVEPLPREAPTEKPAAEAPGFTWTLFILAALGGLGMLGVGAWVLFGDRLERWWYGVTLDDEARQALLAAVEISLDDLLREPDPRRAVIACYRRLEHVLGQHGLPRAPWQTPLEYLHAVLRRFHPPAMLLRGLTTLFELAKFSAHTLGESEKHLAIDALRQVKAALEEEHHVPTT
jgi:Domain of unknown function (DUF4129)